MKIIQKAKEIGSDIEKSVDLVANKTTEVFNNLASHLPFSNLARKQNSGFQIEIDLPGVDKQDVDLHIENDVLIVSATRHFKNELQKDNYYLCESSFGKLERRYVLPENIDKEKIDAQLKDGRLTVELQITQKSKAKQISIK